MPDEFSVAGPTARVRERYGLSCAGIVEACLALVA